MARQKKQVTAGHLIFSAVYLLLWPAVLLFLSGDWYWTEGWIFGIWFIVMCIACGVYLYNRDPQLLAERYRLPGSGGQKKWDIGLLHLLAIIFIIWTFVMPLDAKRYECTRNFPDWLNMIGGIGLLPAVFFIYRSFTDNTYLSPLVRIQKERKQKVITKGVYSMIRHPMYLGAILMFICTPLLLGSAYGIIPGILLSFLLIFRIIGEEKMLTEELKGYKEYKKKVKYRLVPFLW